MKKILFTLAILFLSSLCSIANAIDEEILIIFDASVSMMENFSGEPKYVIAVDEAKNILSGIPSSKPIGLRTIGISLNPSILSYLQNPSEMCKATNLEEKISVNNIKNIKSALDGIFPLGTTPLTYTLDTSINNDFSINTRLKHIILITDGAESCNGNPCNYLRELMRTRKDIKIDIIAIGVNKDDFAELKCITDATSGAIMNVQNRKELKSAFNYFFKPSFSDEIRNDYTNFYNNKNNTIYRNYMFETYK